MDGVLIDAMPFHAEAMRVAIKEETDLLNLFSGNEADNVLERGLHQVR